MDLFAHLALADYFQYIAWTVNYYLLCLNIGIHADIHTSYPATTHNSGSTADELVDLAGRVGALLAISTNH